MEPPPSVRWRGTLLYPTALVAIFLGGQWLLALVGVPGTQQAPVAALPAVAALLLTLPRRLRQAWGAEKPWRQLGLRAPVREAARALLGGLGKALLLLMGVLSALALAGAVAWQPRLTPMLLLNGLLLGSCFAAGSWGSWGYSSVSGGRCWFRRWCSAWCTPASICPCHCF
jgi:hypothetical protein